MEDNNILRVELAETGKGRKKISRKATWTREVKKSNRYKPKRPPKMPSCNHTTIQGQAYHCRTLTVQDIGKFHRNFFQNKTKILQDNFLTKFVNGNLPKKIKLEPRGPRKNVSISYYIPKYFRNAIGRRNVVKVRVCQKAFLEVLSLSKDRVQRICRKMLTSAATLEENRGGDKKSCLYQDRKLRVINFILSLQSLESHYARGKSKIQYLSTDLSIKKLHNMYDRENPEMTVKYEYFRNIFTTKFNLSFKSPSVDACSYCLEYTGKIKLSTDPSEKVNLMAHLRVHKMRAKAFHTMLKTEKDNELTLSFDCQKNMTLPKVADQQAYFSRQLYTYNFTICQGSSTSKQSKSNIFIYSWLETEALKGSNEIASCIFHRLNNTDFDNIHTLNLFCDGCPGQNKNTTVIGMLAHWLKRYAPETLQEIVIHFPIVGHSFLPPDRVFGRLEKRIRKKDVIATPDENIEIFSMEGTVYRGGKDFNFLDWKTSCQSTLKNVGSWGFQFSMMKRFFIKKINSTVKLRGEPYYISDLNEYLLICKRGKTVSQIEPNEIPIGVKVKEAKITDVKNLLRKHFGTNWEDMEALSYFKNVFLNQESMLSPMVSSMAMVVPHQEAEEIYNAEDDSLRI